MTVKELKEIIEDAPDHYELVMPNEMQSVNDVMINEEYKVVEIWPYPKVGRGTK